MFCIYIIYIIQSETLQCLYYRVKMLRANSLHFTFCMMDIQCLTFRLNPLSADSAAQRFFILHPWGSSNMFLVSFLWQRVKKSKAAQYVINDGAAMNIEPSCCDDTLLFEAGSCPCVNWGVITSRGVSECTSQTHRSEHALENTQRWWHVACYYANHQS